MSKNKKIIIGIIVAVLVVCVAGYLVSRSVIEKSINTSMFPKESALNFSTTYANKEYPQTGVVIYDKKYTGENIVQYTVKNVVYDLAPTNYDSSTYGDFAKDLNTLVKVTFDIENLSKESQSIPSYHVTLSQSDLGDMDNASNRMLADKLTGNDSLITSSLTLAPGEKVTKSFYYIVDGRGALALTKNFTLSTYDSKANLVMKD